MNWFIVVYFLVNGSWIEAEKLGKEGWSPILQPNFEVCIEKINETNNRFKKIAEYREIEQDIYFKCECRINNENPDEINCQDRNWIQKFLDKLRLL
tara:strand:- start:241 stop:528 length:288 start_codon:yes stop_codon:yes gene_type:complete